MLRRRGQEKHGHSRLRATAREDSDAGQCSWCQNNTLVNFCTPFSTWGVKFKSLETSHLNQSLHLRNKDVRKERPTEVECPGETAPIAQKSGRAHLSPTLPPVAPLKMLPFTGLALCSRSPSGETFQENLGSGSLCHLQFKMTRDKIPPFFFFFLKILSLSKPPHQCGAYDPGLGRQRQKLE